MTATISSIVKAAESEWKFWGKSTWHVPTNQKSIGHRDDEDTFAQYVLNTYCAVGGGSPSIDDIQDDRYYWSAASSPDETEWNPGDSERCSSRIQFHSFQAMPASLFQTIFVVMLIFRFYGIIRTPFSR